MKKILIVEDEENARTAMVTYLCCCGFEVEATGSGWEAINLGRSFVPDVLVCDWMLEDDYDGVGVARALYQVNKSLHVIFISGFPLEQLRAQCRQLPVDELLSKPFSLTELGRVVAAAAS